jgi:hypothetical protein
MVVRVVDLTQSDEVVEVSSETCCSALFIKDGGIEGRSLIFLQRYDMWDGGASLGVEG